MENASKALIIAGAILISILLITVGIILVNSGRDVTEQGKTSMQSQKIQIFNSQFTPYEGKIKGAQVIELINLTIANNAADSDKMVAVRGYNITRSDIAVSKTYNVVFNYSNGNPLSADTSWFPRVEGSGEWKNLNNCYRNQVTTEKGYINYIFIYE